MISPTSTVLALLTVSASLPALAAAAAPAPTAAAKGLANPFFVFDNGLADAAHKTADAKVRTLKELGCAGISGRPAGLTEMIKAVDAHGVKLFAVYTGVGIDAPDAEIPKALAGVIEQIRGRDTMIWLTLSSRKHKPSDPAGDEAAVKVLRRLADLAAKADVRIALYPHTSNWVERTSDAVRVVKKVGRANLGVTFNLCHWLKVERGKDMDGLLAAAKPHLFLVSINGADVGGRDWKTLIQPLDCGTFDNYKVLGALKKLGYTGPIGLQCYAVRGDSRENLRRSMAAWRRLSRQVTAGRTQLLGDGGLTAWRDAKGWQTVGEVAMDAENPKKLTAKPGAGAAVSGGRAAYLLSKVEHADIEAHIEFMVPKGSNSGVYFQGRYEIQILDSWGVAAPKHGDCGGIYQRWDRGRGFEGRPPRVNASLPPGQWQSFDVVFRAPRFDKARKKIANAMFVKVVHNGRVIHERQEVTGPTRAGMGGEAAVGPLRLQGDHGPVAYRNIWIAELPRAK